MTEFFLVLLRRTVGDCRLLWLTGVFFFFLTVAGRNFQVRHPGTKPEASSAETPAAARPGEEGKVPQTILGSSGDFPACPCLFSNRVASHEPLHRLCSQKPHLVAT